MVLKELMLFESTTKTLYYLDPGSGSYLLQLLIAGALGALLMLRVYWSKVKGFFARMLGREVPEEEVPDEEEE